MIGSRDIIRVSVDSNWLFSVYCLAINAFFINGLPSSFVNLKRHDITAFGFVAKAKLTHICLNTEIENLSEYLG